MKYKKIVLLLTLLLSSAVYAEGTCKQRKECNRSDREFHNHYEHRHYHDRQKPVTKTQTTVKITPRKWNPSK